MDWPAIRLSLRLAASTTAVLLLLGVPLAYWLANTRRRFRFVVEALVAMPLVLPPTVLGFYLLVAFAPTSPLGAWLDAAIGLRLAFSFWGLLAASVIYSLPFAVQPFTAAFAGVDRHLLETSWAHGVSRTATFFRVTLPLAGAGILGGGVVTFAHTMGEFGVVLMIGGNIPGKTRTASIAVFEEVQSLDFAAAARTSGVLLGFCFVALAITSALRARLAKAR